MQTKTLSISAANALLMLKIHNPAPSVINVTGFSLHTQLHYRNSFPYSEKNSALKNWQKLPSKHTNNNTRFLKNDFQFSGVFYH